MRETFPSTHWTELAAGDGALRGRALERLAEGYAEPARAWLVAALGRRDEEARELVQDFFVWVIESGFLGKADPVRGRFRPFLKTALRHFVADAARRGRAAKRGGGARSVSLEGEDAPRDLADPAAPAPDAALDAAWRAEVVRAAQRSLAERLEREGKARVFAVFRDWYLGDEGVDYRALAARHGLTVADVSNYLQRGKRLYREELVARVRATVGSAADLDDELAWLLGGAG